MGDEQPSVLDVEDPVVKMCDKIAEEQEHIDEEEEEEEEEDHESSDAQEEGKDDAGSSSPKLSPQGGNSSQSQPDTDRKEGDRDSNPTQGAQDIESSPNSPAPTATVISTEIEEMALSSRKTKSSLSLTSSSSSVSSLGAGRAHSDSIEETPNQDSASAHPQGAETTEPMTPMKAQREASSSTTPGRSPTSKRRRRTELEKLLAGDTDPFQARPRISRKESMDNQENTIAVKSEAVATTSKSATKKKNSVSGSSRRKYGNNAAKETDTDSGLEDDNDSKEVQDDTHVEKTPVRRTPMKKQANKRASARKTPVKQAKDEEDDEDIVDEEGHEGEEEVQNDNDEQEDWEEDKGLITPAGKFRSSRRASRIADSESLLDVTPSKRARRGSPAPPTRTTPRRPVSAKSVGSEARETRTQAKERSIAGRRSKRSCQEEAEFAEEAQKAAAKQNVPFGKAAIGRRLRVLWPLEKEFFCRHHQRVEQLFK
mmetsp:Transcript_3891/g.6476  ORF Transcript_3891/g.6476 Transcript_3891/m.6476 type:complete len:483 (-) Transcript_3891:2693-4141(-)